MTVALGINCKWADDKMYGMVYGVALCNLALFFTVLFTFEIYHQRILAENDSFKKVQKRMTYSEFE